MELADSDLDEGSIDTSLHGPVIWYWFMSNWSMRFLWVCPSLLLQSWFVIVSWAIEMLRTIAFNMNGVESIEN